MLNRGVAGDVVEKSTTPEKLEKIVDFLTTSPQAILNYVPPSYSCKSLGEFFAGVSGATVTMRYNHFDKKMQRDEALVAKVHGRSFNF
jgi:hypothetical protein